MRKTIGLLIPLISAAPAHASWFEFCELDVVVSSAPVVIDDLLEFKVVVSHASPYEVNGLKGYVDDCDSIYKGRELDAWLSLSVAADISKSDRLILRRSIVDVVTTSGEQSVVRYELVKH